MEVLHISVCKLELIGAVTHKCLHVHMHRIESTSNLSWTFQILLRYMWIEILFAFFFFFLLYLLVVPVEALALLQQQFDVLQEWSGDPCLPATFNWEWVACSSDATPRITAL